MLNFLTAAVMLSTAYVGFREGLFTAVCMLINVFVAGLVAFNFFEPAADALEGMLRNTFLLGYEDYLALIGLFSLCLILLRLVTNNLANRVVEFPSQPQQFGAAGVGLVAGYFVAGLFLCSLHTLPWHENFLGSEPRAENDPPYRTVFPPDRAWLTMMRYAGAYGLSWKEDHPQADSRYDRFKTFDRHGTFELRYFRYRRHGDQRAPIPYAGELEEELERKK